MKIKGKLNLAKAFKVSRTTVENWCKDGCPSHFNGKEHEFTLSEIIAWHEKKFIKSGDNDTESLTKARAVIAHFKGLITELDYKEKSGELIPVAAVKEIAFSSARMARDSILNVPLRVCALLVNQSKEQIRVILDKELRLCLENLANQYCDRESLEKILNESKGEK